MKHWLEQNFPIWFVFGGYSDPGFKGRPEYDPNAPCDVADVEGDVFTRIPHPVAQKLIAARRAYVDAIEEIAYAHPEIYGRMERKS
jgi:hypothetical protein